MHILRDGLFYFVLVFGAGFVLGPIRIALLVPRFGERIAELMEMPIMLGVIRVAATWTVRRYAVTRKLSPAPYVSCVALCLLLAGEIRSYFRFGVYRSPNILQTEIPCLDWSTR
jgi:hypothetical protein